jgi:hypothetical protein
MEGTLISFSNYFHDHRWNQVIDGDSSLSTIPSEHALLPHSSWPD